MPAGGRGRPAGAESICMTAGVARQVAARWHARRMQKNTLSLTELHHFVPTRDQTAAPETFLECVQRHTT